MKLTRLKLKNWRNFKDIDIALGSRVFIVGPNASGKSNLLDAFRFLCDIAKDGGGLQSAIDERNGVAKIRCLAATRNPTVEIEVFLEDTDSNEWRYKVSFNQNKGNTNPVIRCEEVDKNNEQLLRRPGKAEENDPALLTQTHLEQVGANKTFRVIADYFKSIYYLHIIPHVARHPEEFSRGPVTNDPYGRDFMGHLADANKKTRDSRLKKISKALKIAVPQMKELSFVKDKMGIPHLQAVYEHWRTYGAKQREDQFSDGTLRFIGFLWALQEARPLFLLEEPEISLHAELVKRIPALIYSVRKDQQVVVTTHSVDLLSDRAIGGEEVVVLTPTKDGTTAELASSIEEIRLLLEGGMPAGDAVIPHVAPKALVNGAGQGLLDLWR